MDRLGLTRLLWSRIYMYDPTYRVCFEKVLCHIRMNAHLLQLSDHSKHLRYKHFISSGKLCMIKSVFRKGNVLIGLEPCELYCRITHPIRERRKIFFSNPYY